MHTSGYLPIGPFRHLDPTAVAEVALHESPLQLSPVGSGWPETARDTLLLVRLHESPVGLVHIDRPPDHIDETCLADAIWDQAGNGILEHFDGCGRDDAPHDASAIRAGIGPSGRCCGSSTPPDPGLSAALIIPTAGRGDRLARCLDSLVSVARRDLEIIIVDNAPGSGDVREVVTAAADRLHGIRYVPEPRPGSSVARNRGVAETEADIVAFTDDDVIVDPHWLDWLLAPFVADEVGCVTGMVLPLELETPAQKQFELYAGFSKGLDRRVYDLGANSASHRLLYPYWGGVFGSGNSMAFRRAALIGDGGFDPALGAGSVALAGADIEALSAVVRRGDSLVYEPRSLCWHEHRRDEGALRRQVFNYGVGFTAILTKSMLRDRRFPRAVARSVPIAVELRKRRLSAQASTHAPALPQELARLQRRGMLRGPDHYLRSTRWARSLGLDNAIKGR
jgi:glycosyltransferase involved in cell wall biosynthesis